MATFKDIGDNQSFLSPEQVTSRRKMAQAMIGKGTDTSPVGHWTQALARVVQGGIGGYSQDSADTGERDGRRDVNARLTKALTSKAPLSETATSLMGNPYSEEAGQSLAISAMKQNADDPQKDYRARDAQWRSMGYTEADPGYKEFILTNKLPRTGADGGGKFGLNPIYGTDKDGNPVIMQLSEDGGITPAQLPEGIVPSKNPIKMDAGTHFILLDPITRQQIGSIPKDLAGAEAAKTEGEAKGKAKVNLPLVELNAAKLTKNIDAVVDDPFLPQMTGPISGMLPNVSAKSQNLQSRIDQIQGQTFLQAFNDLRGGGAITDTEGQKATNAYNRLNNMKVDDPNYVTALREFKLEVADLLEVARRKAGVSKDTQHLGGPPRVTNTEEYNALPPNTLYIDPKGVERTKR
jgi:hypothetical protein